MAKVWHPDRFPNDPKLQLRGQEKLKEINAAYEILTNYFAEKSSFTTSKPPSDSNSRPKQPHPQPNRPSEAPKPEPTYSQPEPPPPEHYSGTMLEMICHHCQGGVQFPEEMERETIACPNCGKELFLWRREVKRNMRSFSLEPEGATTEFDAFANKVEAHPGLAIVLRIIGVICVAFGLIDFAGMFFHYDITGVSWSPIVAIAIGTALLNKTDTKEKKISNNAGNESSWLEKTVLVPKWLKIIAGIIGILAFIAFAIFAYRLYKENL